MQLTKSNIASMYGVSRPTLVKWIKNNPRLMDSLHALGYDSFSTRLLTPAMFGVIKQYLGEPPHTLEDNL